MYGVYISEDLMDSDYMSHYILTMAARFVSLTVSNDIQHLKADTTLQIFLY